MINSELPLIVSSRGRNPDNPSDRKDTSNLEQRLEIQSEGISNTLSTVQKDNYVLENTRKVKHQQDNIMTENDLCITQCAGLSERYNVFTEYAIRKLTPKKITTN